MSKVITDDQLDGMIKSAVASMGALPPDEKFSLLVNALRELRDYRKTTASAVPDGWKLVPIVPTEDMVIRGFESKPAPFWSTPEEWAEYEAMSGCQQAAYQATLCWQAMLAAAPEVE